MANEIKRYRKSLLIFILAEREGLFALRAHPSGPPWRALSPSGGEGGIDSGHPGPRPAGALRASKIAPAILSNPLLLYLGLESQLRRCRVRVMEIDEN